MAAHNPYAPSAASLKMQREPTSASDGVWRDGKYLMMEIDAALPHRCVKCNGPAQDPTKRRTYYWHSPGLYVLIFIGLVIYAIVAMIVRKSVKVEPALCAEHKRQRRNKILFAWGGVLGSFVVPFVLGAVLPPDNGWIVLVGILMFFGSVIYGFAAPRILWPKRIDENEARLGGCGEEFLDSLPEYPR